MPKDVRNMLKHDSIRRCARRLTDMVKEFIETRKDEDPVKHLRLAGLEDLLSPRGAPVPKVGEDTGKKTGYEISESETSSDED